MNSDKKLKRILSDHINGNFSDFRRAVKRLNKLELLSLITAHFGFSSQDENLKFINKLCIALDPK